MELSICFRELFILKSFKEVSEVIAAVEADPFYSFIHDDPWVNRVIPEVMNSTANEFQSIPCSSNIAKLIPEFYRRAIELGSNLPSALLRE